MKRIRELQIASLQKKIRTIGGNGGNFLDLMANNRLPVAVLRYEPILKEGVGRPRRR